MKGTCIFSLFHFCLSCSKGPSLTRCFQNRSGMYWTCLHLRFIYSSRFPNSPGGNAGLLFRRRLWFGIRGSRLMGSSDSWEIGRSFNKVSTSRRTVWNPSSSKRCWCSTDLRILLIVLIMLPICTKMRCSRWIKFLIYSSWYECSFDTVVMKWNKSLLQFPIFYSKIGAIITQQVRYLSSSTYESPHSIHPVSLLPPDKMLYLATK